MIAKRLTTLFLITSVVFLSTCATAGREIPVGKPYEGWTGAPLAGTDYGYVLGYQDNAGTLSWKGIPYAAPPVDELRWKAPEKPVPWTGVLEAKGYGSPCTQHSPLGGNNARGCEDCLYLNIWRPETDEKDLPVYVWIHGGGNSIGSADMVPDYRGDNLASRGNLVFVSINYRLGPFGWFTHPSLRTGRPEDKFDDSGNYGALDIIRALEWIQENIASFGGDPERVTIAGESAGSFNVTSLLISPPAEGLFYRAVSQSGGLRTSTVEEGDKSSAETLSRLLEADKNAAVRVGRAMSGKEIAAYLRSRSAEEILSVYAGGFGGMLGIPNIFTDGAVIPENGYETLRDGSYPSQVPIILGSNADEPRLFLTFSPDYRGKDELFDLVSKLGSDNWKAESVDTPAGTITSLSEHPPVYVYHFRWGSVREDGSSVMPGNWGFELGATHSLDIPFFFGHETFVYCPRPWT